MAKNDSTRIIKAVVNDGVLSSKDVNDALRQLCMMVYKLEGRLGQIELRDGVHIAADSQRLLSATRVDGSPAAYHEVSFTGTAGEATNITKGASFHDEQVRAEASVGCVMRMDKDGFHFYVNDGLTPQTFYPLNEVAAITTVGVVTVPPTVRVYRSSATTVPDTTTVTISFDTETFDASNMWVIGSPTRLTIATPGYYLFGYNVEFTDTSNATRTQEAFMRLDGTDAVRYGESKAIYSGTSSMNFNGSGLELLSAGQYIELRVASTDAAATDGTVAAVANTSPVLWTIYLGSS